MSARDHTETPPGERAPVTGDAGRFDAVQARFLTRVRQLDTALGAMTQGLAMFDDEHRLVLCNARFLDVHRLPQSCGTPGTALDDIVAAAVVGEGLRQRGLVRRAVARVLAAGVPRTREITTNGGRIVAITVQPIEGGGWLSTHEDVTERRRADQRINRLARVDLLTGVANRSCFLEAIEAAGGRLSLRGAPFTVLMLDLDRFKTVNDSLGHAAGDALLKEAAARLAASLRSSDVLARLGGDEFAVIQAPPRMLLPQDDVASVMRESAAALARRIISVIEKPFLIDGQDVVIGTSIGIALAPTDATDPDDLMKKADLALYTIKAAGRNGFAFFDREMAARADERHRLEVDMRAGLARDEFELHYQPIVDVATRRVHGMEALVRWHHPERGTIEPARFIAMAEETGLIVPLGEWVLETACAQAVRWPADLSVAVNVSACQFRRSDLVGIVTAALERSGLPPHRLEIEITERVLVDWCDEHLAMLHRLRALGVSIALDDFGTGYSSLGHLTAFPFDKIKIDSSFVRDLLTNGQNGAIVCAIINLGRSLDIVTVAEGVETPAQLAMLRAAGIHQLQGRGIGPPAPVGEALRSIGLAETHELSVRRLSESGSAPRT